MQTAAYNLSSPIPVESTRLSAHARSALISQLSLSMVALGPAAASRLFECSYLGRELAILVARGADPRRVDTVCKIILTRKIAGFGAISGLVDLSLVSDKVPRYRALAQARITNFLRQLAGIP